MGNLDSIIFGKKKFSDILEEIYQNQKRREDQVSSLISEFLLDLHNKTII